MLHTKARACPIYREPGEWDCKIERKVDRNRKKEMDVAGLLFP